MNPALLATTLVFLSLCVLGARTGGGAVFEWGAAVGFCAVCFFGLAARSIRETLLLILSVGLALVFVWQGGDKQILIEAIDLAAFFAAFILLLTALKIAAERSKSVLDVGRYLIHQPAAGRYLATASGGHLLGVFLNFGAISLMAPLIQKAARGDDGAVNTGLERRQISALLRGFAWILLWAPTTLTQAVLLTLFTEIDYGEILTLGIATSALMIGVGFLFDRFEWRNTTLDITQAPPLPMRAFWRLAAVCAALIVSTVLLQLTFEFTTALALMFVAPVVTVLWFLAQRPKNLSYSGQLGATWLAFAQDAPGLARSAMALGLSGFVGRMLADVLPMQALAASFDLSDMPGWVFLSALPILITLGGQIALSPIIVVVFIGQVVQILPVLPADPTHVVFALSAGWALSMFASPNATATLLISVTTRLAPTTLTWSWNLRFGAVCYAVLVMIFVALAAG